MSLKNFNTDYWPVVFFKTNNSMVNDEKFEEFKKFYLNLLLRCKKNNDKMILIFNVNLTENIPIKYIMRQAEFNKQVEKFNKEYIKCVCIVCDNKNFKNILNLYLSFVKPVSPYKLCRSFDKVNKYLVEKHNINFNSHTFDNYLENKKPGCDIEAEDDFEELENGDLNNNQEPLVNSGINNIEDMIVNI
jgi:hypothetical protein